MTESQYIKLKALEKTKTQDLKDAQTVASADMLPTFVAEINERFETAVLQLLKPAQQEAYVASKGTFIK